MRRTSQMPRSDSRQASQRRSSRWKTALEVDGHQRPVDELNFVVKPVLGSSSRIAEMQSLRAELNYSTARDDRTRRTSKFKAR